MFHHYSENSSSTGEPPTLPSDNISINLISEQIVPTGNMNREETIQMSHSSNSGSSRCLAGQEPDSGYEASPSSLADNPGSFHFFGEQSMAVTNPHSSRQYSDAELEQLNCQSQFLFSESESDIEDWNTCPDCNSSANCDCDRTDSSTTYVTTAISNCDNNSSSRSNSSDLSSNRPSSQPIEIPVLRSYRPDLIIDPRVDLRLQPARSQPLDFNRITTFGFESSSHGVSSWPSTIPTWRIQSSIALPFFLESLSSRYAIPRTNRLRRSNRRVSRRQIIDSDASSSVCSSDDDGPEDVFNMAGEEPSSFTPMLANSVPLPDVVILQSSDSTRRSRSVSVNLPPDPALLQSIGQTLRRLSDQFQRRREIVMAARSSRRRQTIGSISYLNNDHS